MILPERRPPKHGDRDLLHRALDHRGLLPVILPPPLRLAPHVHHDAAHRADVPPPHLPGAGLLVPLAARLRDPPPRAPRLQRHGAGPARPGLLRQRAQHDVDDRRALQRAPAGDVVPRAALPRQLSRLALARPRRLDLGGARRLGHDLRARLPLARDGVVAVPAPSRPLGARTGTRRDRQLVRPPLRLSQLPDQRRLAELPALRLPHPGRALPEQPPPRREPPQLRLAPLRVRPDLRGDAPPRLGPRHPSPPGRAREPRVAARLAAQARAGGAPGPPPPAPAPPRLRGGTPRPTRARVAEDAGAPAAPPPAPSHTNALSAGRSARP